MSRCGRPNLSFESRRSARAAQPSRWASHERRRLMLSVLALAFTSSLGAAPLVPAVRAEVMALLSALENSGCEFSRNGSWYSGSEAKAHLLRKLAYLEGKNMVQSTEQFIDRGASTSSSTGKPYLVKCGSVTPVESKKWLEKQLSTMRSGSPARASNSK